MRIMVTGSRKWTDQQAITRAILSWMVAAGGEVLHVVHGGAEGADTLADRVLRKALPAVNNLLRAGFQEPVTLDIKVMRPDYLPRLPKSDPGYAQRLIDNNRAPLRRNDDMLDTRPDVVLAFKLGYASYGGTQYIINGARARGIPVWIVNHPEPEDESVQADEGATA